MKVIFCKILFVLLLISSIFLVYNINKTKVEAVDTGVSEDKQESVNKSGLYSQVASTIIFRFVFNLLKEFDKDIYNDLSLINFDIGNSDIDKVLKARKVSFYKYIPIIKTDTSRAGTFLCIMLSHNEDINTVLHEYGHTRQEIMMGPILYLLFIGIPSYFELSDISYYNRPWEVTADMFGGLDRTSRVQENEPIRSFEYEALGLCYLVGILNSKVVLNKMLSK